MQLNTLIGYDQWKTATPAYPPIILDCGASDCEGIYEGEEYMLLDGSAFHRSCVTKDDMLKAISENLFECDLLQILAEYELLEIITEAQTKAQTESQPKGEFILVGGMN